MSDTIQLYPKSSCDVNFCKSEYKPTNGFKSNLSVNGCSISPYFDCYNRLELNNSKQPVPEEETVYMLNKNVYVNKYSRDFDKVPCKIAECKESYISMDPRLYSTTLSNYIPLEI